MRVNVFHDSTFPDGTRVSAGQAQWASGQVVGIGWLVVRVGDGEWEAVDFASQLKLHLTIEDCDDAEELRAWVIEGSQWAPYVRVG